MNPYVWKATAEEWKVSHNNMLKEKMNTIAISKYPTLDKQNSGAHHPTLSEYLQDFGSRSTIMGVYQVSNRQQFCWKIFWIVISVSCAAMAIIQSWKLLQDFIGGKTIQSTVYSSMYDFPSVTFCSNIHLDSKRRTEFNWQELTYLTKENSSHLTYILETLLQKENETRLSPFGATMKLGKCEFNKRKCDKSDENEIFHFDTAFYGNCFTYNLGIHKIKTSRPYYYLSLRIPVDKASRQIDLNDNYISIWIHPTGSAPVLYKQEAIQVYPGDTVDIKLQMKKVSRISNRENECIDAFNDQKRFSSIYYTKQTPYLYTTKACIYSMIFDAKKEAFHCLDPAIPRNEIWKSEWQTGNYNICLPGLSTANVEEENSTDLAFDFDANCTFPCSEWNVDYTTIITSAWMEVSKIYSATALNLAQSDAFTSNKSYSSRVGMHSSNENSYVMALVDASLKENRAESGRNLNFDNRYVNVKVGLGSPIIEEVQEYYKYTIGDFAGIIGGNIGLWIGLSIISFTEIIELLINLTVLVWYIIKSKFS